MVKLIIMLLRFSTAVLFAAMILNVTGTFAAGALGVVRIASQKPYHVDLMMSNTGACGSRARIKPP